MFAGVGTGEREFTGGGVRQSCANARRGEHWIDDDHPSYDESIERCKVN
jgi:hypothetical protein